MGADHPIPQSSVHIYQEAGEWRVCVSEAGEKPYSQEFHTHEFAANYAEGQRIRLGLDKVEDPRPDDRMPP
jgi:hypothetical protein